MKIYRDLFTSFFRIGLFTFGGGYAMIPLIEAEVVDKKNWIKKPEFIDMLALAQSAPGVMAINTSIFVGHRLRGLKGAIVASLGSALPSFVIILLIAMFFINFKDNPAVERIFKGIRPAVVALIAAPLWRMGKSAKITWKTILFPIGTAVLIWQFGLSPIIFVAAGILTGIGWGAWKNIRKMNKPPTC
ncbi:MAG: chromate transporter [Prevotellaceae bacterium]|nr:chromate transporter [Prevotellaceae bacterium]